MIGHNVDEQTHAVRVELFQQLLELQRGSERWIEPGRVDDVVAVRAPRRRRENRRDVEGFDAKIVK